MCGSDVITGALHGLDLVEFKAKSGNHEFLRLNFVQNTTRERMKFDLFRTVAANLKTISGYTARILRKLVLLFSLERNAFFPVVSEGFAFLLRRCCCNFCKPDSDV